MTRRDTTLYRHISIFFSNRLVITPILNYHRLESFESNNEEYIKFQCQM